MTYTALSAMRRAQQMFYEQISERVTLDHGLAFVAPEFPDSVSDNSLREVWVQTPAECQAAWTQAERCFAEQGLVCRSWIPCAQQEPEILEPFLLGRGWTRRSFLVMQLAGWPAMKTNPDVRVLPARAMRQAFRALCAPDQADLAEARLDYAQFDVAVATVNGQPAGRGGLLQVGEIGCVRDLFVVPALRRQGVGTSLLAHLLEMARRLMMKIVVLRIEPDNAAGRTFFARHQFLPEGELVEYVRSDADI